MKMTTKKFSTSTIKSIPFNFKKELTGYIDEKGIHYTEGTKVNCPTFPDKTTVFHTHVDILPTDSTITLPDMPSPVDIIVFMVIGNDKMFIKTPRVFITLEKTKQCERITEKILTCIMENEIQWKKMVKEQKHDMMFYFLLHQLKKDMHKKNRIWNLSWKRIVEKVFKIKVTIETSDINDPL